jgi:hypothetical protein
MLVTIGRVDVEVTNDMTEDEIENVMHEAGEKNKKLEQEENGRELAKEGINYMLDKAVKEMPNI